MPLVKDLLSITIISQSIKKCLSLGNCHSKMRNDKNLEQKLRNIIRLYTTQKTTTVPTTTSTKQCITCNGKK